MIKYLIYNKPALIIKKAVVSALMLVGAGLSGFFFIVIFLALGELEWIMADVALFFLAAGVFGGLCAGCFIFFAQQWQTRWWTKFIFIILALGISFLVMYMFQVV